MYTCTKSIQFYRKGLADNRLVNKIAKDPIHIEHAHINFSNLINRT